jgi:SAM-dependent methyltransferase
MHISEIRKTWINPNKNTSSDTNLWDSQAQDPIYNITPTLQTNKFLQLLQQENMLQPTYQTLDIGCGVGVYSIAIANQVHHATGIDLSPKMIERGKEKLQTEKIPNVTLTAMDWSNADLAQLGFEEKFDLVFAHTTPAICDAETFEKMNAASRRFCVISNPSKMVEPVLEQVHKLVGVEGDRSNCGNDRIYMLDMLFHMGYLPKLVYEAQVWGMNQPLEEACSYYIGRTMMAKQLTPDEITKVKEYLASIAKEGRVIDQIDTTITTIYWEKTAQK